MKIIKSGGVEAVFNKNNIITIINKTAKNNEKNYKNTK